MSGTGKIMMDPGVVETAEKKQRRNDTSLLFTQPAFPRSTLRSSRSLCPGPPRASVPCVLPTRSGVAAQAQRALVVVGEEQGSRIRARPRFSHCSSTQVPRRLTPHCKAELSSSGMTWGVGTAFPFKPVEGKRSGCETLQATSLQELSADASSC